MTFKDHFSGHADVYAAFRPLYPPELFEYLAKLCESRAFAWDCATGNGQAAKALQPFFSHVQATDGSETQIANASPLEGVVFAVAQAHESGLTNESVDLITVAQAIHWFDMPAFFKEADRVLKPNGVLAVWGYGLAMSGRALDKIIENYYQHEVGSFWPPERNLIERRYETVPFPYPKEQVPVFEMKSERTAEQLLGYLRTWSASKRFEAEFGYDPVSLIEAEVHAAWPEREELTFSTPIFLHVGRKAS